MENGINYGIIALYMAVVIGVGFFFTNKEENTENYLLGGRNLPYIAVGLSMVMTALSSISIVQVPGEIFNHGWTLFSFGIFVSLMSIPSYLLFVRFYFKLGSFTPFEYLEYRYDKTVRGVVAVTGFYGGVMYLGMVLYTTGKIFEGAYGWPIWFTLLLVGIVGVLYTVLGGMKAVVWTDVIQFFVLAGGLICVLYVLNKNVDGGLPGGVIYSFENGHGAPQYLTKEFYHVTPYIRLCFWLMLWGSLLGPLCSNASNQSQLQRILSTKDWKAGFKSQIISTSLGIISILVLYVLGFAIYAYYAQNPDPIVTEKGGDLAFFRFVATKMPMPLPGIFMAAILAAIMSTLDSCINSMATVWLKEIHVKFINKHLSPKQEVSVARKATFLIGVFAICFGLALHVSGRWLSQSVSEVGTIFYMLGSASVPAFLFAVLSKRANATLIWAYTLFATGESIGQNIWYSFSRNAVQSWEKDPALGFGWGGKLDVLYVLVPFCIGLLLCAPWFFAKYRKRVHAKILAMLGTLVAGMSYSFFLWWAYSNAYVTDRPLECSFAFGLPTSIVVAFIVLWFCPVQPEKKWRGLTIATVNEGMIKE